MASKKDETRFTIKFNPENPRHQEAIRILNEVGRAKATMIADALHLYAYNNGRMVTVIASDEVRRATSISYAANSTEAHASPSEIQLNDEYLWQTVGKSIESFFS